MSEDTFASLYNPSGDEVDAFGEHWCGPSRYEKGVSTLIARYEPFSDDQGRQVEVYGEAYPAVFYTIRVLPNDEQPGYEFHTATGQYQLAAQIAEGISSGMVDLEWRRADDQN